MSSLTIRRIIVWTLAAVLGVLTSWLVLTFFLPAVSPSPTASAVSIGKFGKQYFLWTALPFALVFMTILDGFMDTRIWPD